MIPSKRYREIHGGPPKSSQVNDLLVLLDELHPERPAPVIYTPPKPAEPPTFRIPATPVNLVKLPPRRPPTAPQVFNVSETSLLRFLREHEGKWFTPAELREAATPTLAVSTVNTYAMCLAKKLRAPERVEIDRAGKALNRFRYRGEAAISVASEAREATP